MLRPDLSWWSAARVEIDQRARETRLRLEHLERLLISRVVPPQVVAAPARLSAWATFFPWRARAKPIGKDRSDRHAAAPSIARYPD